MKLHKLVTALVLAVLALPLSAGAAAHRAAPLKVGDKGWKVKVNFDTSKPADPETGLSPISNIEIEGNEKTVKTLLQEDDTIHVSESQETKNDLTLQQRKQSASHKDAGSSVAAGIDNGIQYGLIIGIPIILIILTLIIHARFKQKDSSK